MKRCELVSVQSESEGRVDLEFPDLELYEVKYRWRWSEVC